MAMELLRSEELPIQESLSAFPVVLLTGARQVGKTTLVQRIARGAWGARYVTLDDPVTREAALRDPDGFLASTPPPLVLDEVQGVPDLLRAVKLRVDRMRDPGQYLLTGSANLLAMRQVEESLAGRVAIHELLPLSLAERLQRPGVATRLDDLFAAPSAARLLASLGAVRHADDHALNLRPVMLSGGYPTPALTSSARIRSRWFASYVQSYVERDLPAIAGIQFLGSFQRLLALLLLRSGNLLNVMDLSRTLGLSAATVQRYVDLLRLTYQVSLLPPLAANPEKRLVKTPKVYGGDTGLLAAMTGAVTWDDLMREGRAGALFETWVHGELTKLLALSTATTNLSFWRKQTGPEVDFILRRGQTHIAIEAKTSAAGLGPALRNFHTLEQEQGLHLGIVVHLGDEAIALSDRVAAVPAHWLFA